MPEGEVPRKTQKRELEIIAANEKTDGFSKILLFLFISLLSFLLFFGANGWHGKVRIPAPRVAQSQRRRKIALDCRMRSGRHAPAELVLTAKTAQLFTVRNVFYGISTLTPSFWLGPSLDQPASRPGRGSLMGGAVAGLGGGSPIGISPGDSVGTAGGVGGSTGCGRCMGFPCWLDETQSRYCKQC